MRSYYVYIITLIFLIISPKIKCADLFDNNLHFNGEGVKKNTYINICQKGDSFPDLEFCCFDGRNLTMIDLKGKIVVINRWFIACKPCVSEISGLNYLVEKYKSDSNIVFIAIANEKHDVLKNFLSHTKFDYLQTTNKKEFNLVFGNSYPVNIIVDTKGIIRFSNIGYYKYIIKDMEHIIEKLKNRII